MSAIAIYRQLAWPVVAKHSSSHSLYHSENVAPEPSHSCSGLSPENSLRLSSRIRHGCCNQAITFTVNVAYP